MFEALRPSRRKRWMVLSDNRDDETTERHLVPVPESDDGVLSAARLLIEERLPWTSRLDDAPVQMSVVEAGYLERRYRDFPIGTPYVDVGVASWEAAAAVHEALASVARLSEAAWRVGWRSDGAAYRTIRVFPQPD